MKIFYFISFVLLSGFGVYLHAEALPDARELLAKLDTELLDSLEQNRHIFRYDEEFIGPQYLPVTEGRRVVEDIHRSLSPEVMVEALYSVPYPEGLDADLVLNRIFELSSQVSSLSGAKYYSERRKKYAVLFSDVYAVNNLSDKDKIGDPVPSVYDTDQTVFLHIKENALGRGYYRMDYSKSDSLFSVKITNETELGFIVTAVSPGDMIIYLQVVPCSDTILIYGYCGVVLQNDDFIDLILDPYYAFYRRMTAMETWLSNSLHGTDSLPPLHEPMP